MSEIQPSLRRFAERRRQQRHARVAIGIAPISTERLIHLSVRIAITTKEKMELGRIQTRSELSRAATVSRVIRWFVAQPSMVQSIVLKEKKISQGDFFAFVHETLPDEE